MGSTKITKKSKLRYTRGITPERNEWQGLSSWLGASITQLSSEETSQRQRVAVSDLTGNRTKDFPRRWRCL